MSADDTLRGAQRDDARAARALKKARNAEPRIIDPATHPKRHVNLAVAAEYLSVHPATLRKYLDEGLLDYLWFGRRRKIEVIELVAFERRQRVTRRAS